MRFIDLDQLAEVHAAKRLELAFTVGLQGRLELEGDACALVDELITLARFGVKMRQLAEVNPNCRASTVVRQADRIVRRTA